MTRACGACSLCCKVMGVPEVKERHDWCPHADPGHGCKIYEERPAPCRTFSCRWLLDETLPAHWFPRTARIVIDLAEEVYRALGTSNASRYEVKFDVFWPGEEP